MLLDIINANYVEGYSVYIEFEDGTRGVVDLTDCANDDGVFEPLKDQSFFRKVSLDNKTGTITWPNGADLSPEFLYERLASNRQHN